MKERPILFSARLVVALLARKKTQTRRLAKFKFFEGQNPNFSGYTPGCYHSGIASSGYVLRSRGAGGCWNDRTEPLRPYALVGDRLWVRETWAPYSCPQHDQGQPPGTACLCRKVDYRATSTLPLHAWKPSIFMPRWASRITLDVVSVRIERLQEISEEDAMAEGVAHRIAPGGDLSGAFGFTDAAINYRNHFSNGWDSINGEGSWSKNPWVWVIGFKVLE